MAERHTPGHLLSAFLDDELDDDAAMHVARHLAGCDRCLQELAGLRAARDALRRLPSLQAPVLTARMVARTRRLRWVRRVVRVGVSVAVLPVALLLVAYVVGADVGSIEPSTDLFLVEHVGRTGGGAFPTPVADGR